MAISSTCGLCVSVCLFLSIIWEVEGVIIYPPSNRVAEVNGEAIFNCSTTSSPPFAWILTRDGITSGEIIIATVCMVTAGLENHYRTEQPGGQATCSLIVFNIAMEQAGVYHCTETDTYRALLTVLDSSPVITDNSTTAVVENESVISECSLNYNGSMEPAPTLRPYFYWTNLNGQNVSSYYDSTTENTAVSRLAVTAARGNITSYTCLVYLQLEPTATGGYANNNPTVDMRASSSTIEVLYPPIISTISSEGRNDSTRSCEISTVTCHATAHPTANYTWIDLKESTKIIYYGQSFGYAEFGRSYNCSATNIIRTIAYTDVKTHDERDEYSTRPPCKGCHNSTMNITGETCTNGRCSCLFDCNMTVICTADAYPEPTYHWMQNGQVIRYDTNTLDNVPDGIYSCVAKNVIDGYEFEARIDVEVIDCSANCKFTNSFVDTTVEMPSTPSSYNKTAPTTENDDDSMIIVGIMLVYEIANLISMGFFLAYYNMNTDANTNGNNRNVATHKMALNNRFPWLERMLPCMNQSHENTGKNCLWIFLFSLITISCGVFIFPILIIIVKCCGTVRTDIHGSQGVFKRSDSSAPGATKPNSNSEEPQYQDLFKETSTIGSEYEELRH